MLFTHYDNGGYVVVEVASRFAISDGGAVNVTKRVITALVPLSWSSETERERERCSVGDYQTAVDLLTEHTSDWLSNRHKTVRVTTI